MTCHLSVSSAILLHFSEVSEIRSASAWIDMLTWLHGEASAPLRATNHELAPCMAAGWCRRCRHRRRRFSFLLRHRTYPYLRTDKQVSDVSERETLSRNRRRSNSKPRQADKGTVPTKQNATAASLCCTSSVSLFYSDESDPKTLSLTRSAKWLGLMYIVTHIM